MYIGESERNVRAVFAQARAAAPSVLFFDELDSLAPQRGRGSDSGGVMDRVVAQLLVELDGVSSGGGGVVGGREGGGARKDVFVIGATNRPDLLDSSLLRPGRFDRLLYLGNSQDPSNRLSILQASTRKFTLAPNVNLQEVVARVPVTFTGADFSAVAAQALMRALKRRVAELEEELEVLNEEEEGEGGREGGKEGVLSLRAFLGQLAPEELEARVRQEDLMAAAAAVTPSVSMEELQHYEKLRAQFSSTHVAVATAAPTLSSLPSSGGGGGGGGGGGLRPAAAAAASGGGGSADGTAPRGLGGGLAKGGVEKPKGKEGSHGGRGGGGGGGGGVEESKSGGGGGRDAAAGRG